MGWDKKIGDIGAGLFVIFFLLAYSGVFDTENIAEIYSDDYSGISKIYVSNNVIGVMDNKLVAQGEEFIYCAYTKKYNDSYLIYKIVEPEGVVSSTTQVEYEDCDFMAAMTIHSHPGGSCELSGPGTTYYDDGGSDLTAFKEERFDMIGVVCGFQKLSIFTKEDPTVTIDVVMVNADNSTKNITVTNPCFNEAYYCNGECYEECPRGSSSVCTSEGIECWEY